MRPSLECIEYRGAGVTGAPRRKRGRLDARLIDLQGREGIEVRERASKRAQRIPVSKLIALTIDGERHDLDAPEDDDAARMTMVRRLLDTDGSPAARSPAAALIVPDPAPGAPVSPEPHMPPRSLTLAERQAALMRAQAGSASPDRAYGCLLFAGGAICLLEVLIMVVWRFG